MLFRVPRSRFDVTLLGKSTNMLQKVVGNGRNTVSRVLFRKRELTEILGKLGEFRAKLGEFALPHK